MASMVEISSADHLATSADRIMNIVRQPASYATPQPQAEVSPFSPTSTHDTNQSSAPPASAPGPVLDFGPERGPGKGTMADLGAFN